MLEAMLQTINAWNETFTLLEIKHFTGACIQSGEHKEYIFKTFLLMFSEEWSFIVIILLLPLITIYLTPKDRGDANYSFFSGKFRVCCLFKSLVHPSL